MLGLDAQEFRVMRLRRACFAAVLALAPATAARAEEPAPALAGPLQAPAGAPSRPHKAAKPQAARSPAVLPPGRPHPRREAPADPVALDFQWRATNSAAPGNNLTQSTVNQVKRSIPGSDATPDNRFGLGLKFKY
jgi:hypothetical protein